MHDLASAWRSALPDAGQHAVRDAVTSALGDTWTIRDDGCWLHAWLPSAPPPVQGWKIHLSAGPGTLLEACHRAVPVLAAAGVAFKVCRDLAVATEMVSVRYERSGAGKAITAYPRGATQCAGLLAGLCAATRGLVGPRIAGDARVRADAPVYYRYGVGTGVPWLSDDGLEVNWLRAPDGTVVPDQRERFAPPAWADPLPLDSVLTRAGKATRYRARASAEGAAAPAPAVVAGRWRVVAVLARSARGGVFSAVDDATGEQVVIKQANAHIGTAPGWPGDARDRLRHEASVLRDLAETGLVPRLLTVIEADDSTFAVESFLPGHTLLRWRGGNAGYPVAADAVLTVAENLTHAICEVHSRGLVIRDLSPSNVIVGPGQSVSLVDLELAARPGDRVTREYTTGYAAPEQLRAPLTGPAPGQAADRYALGALLFYLATGGHLHGVPADERPDAVRDSAIARLAFASSPLPTAVIAALLDTEPRARPALSRVKAALRPAVPGLSGPASTSRDPAVSAPATAVLLNDTLAALAAIVRKAGDERMWPVPSWERPRERCCLSHGAAGPLLTLAVAARLNPSLARVEDVAAAAQWVLARATAVPRVLPGLASGRPGVVMALSAAARTLASGRLAEAAAPLISPLAADDAGTGPGLAHGAAGPLLALAACAVDAGAAPCCAPLGHAAASVAHSRIDALLRTLGKRERAGQAGWASGAAGSGYALLRAGEAFSRADAIEAAIGLAAHVARAVTVPAAGAPDHAHDTGLAGMTRFLLAASEWGGPDPAQAVTTLTECAARRMAGAPPGYARGLAGVGDVLIEAAERGETSPEMPGRIAGALAAQAVRLDGRWLVPDDSGTATNPGFAHGLSGVAWFLNRLAVRSPAWP